MILGLDISSVRTGWALSKNGVIMMSGAWKLAKKQQRFDLLQKMCEDLSHVKIRGAIIEKPFGHTNTIFSLGRMHGAVDIFLEGRDIEVLNHVHPTSLKKFATGSGRADKSEILLKAREIYPDCENHDEADAIFLSLYK